MKTSWSIFSVVGVLIAGICCSPRELNEKCENYKKQFQKSPPSSEGVSAQLGEFPHIAALVYYNENSKTYKIKCGGVLISSKYIVTPAHCLALLPESLEFARLGAVSAPSEIKAPDNQLDYKIKNATVYPTFNSYTYNDDIALLELEKDVIFGDNIRPACLNTQENSPDKVVFAEWGENDSSKVNLYKLKLAPMANQECSAIYMQKFKRGISDKQMCAKHDRSDTCKGEIQGPLQIANAQLFTLVAIPAYGPGCGYDFPTMYTKIYGYLDWIKNIVFNYN